MSTKRILSAFAAVAMMSALLGGLPSASALSELPIDDVTKKTVTSMSATGVVSVQRAASLNFDTNDQQTVSYEYRMFPTLPQDGNCELFRNGTSLAKWGCSLMKPFHVKELQDAESGTYRLAFANGKTIASWTFQRPSDVARPLRSAGCTAKLAMKTRTAKVSIGKNRWGDRVVKYSIPVKKKKYRGKTCKKISWTPTYVYKTKNGVAGVGTADLTKTRRDGSPKRVEVEVLVSKPAAVSSVTVELYGRTPGWRENISIQSASF
jgi:hypothetical protein